MRALPRLDAAGTIVSNYRNLVEWPPKGTAPPDGSALDATKPIRVSTADYTPGLSTSSADIRLQLPYSVEGSLEKALLSEMDSLPVAL